jgi:hypothetical protein
VPKPEHSDGVPLLYQRQWAEAAWCSACAGALDTRAERYHLPNGEDAGPRPLWAVLGQGMAEAKSISLPHPFPLISPVHVERPVCGERQMGDKRCRGLLVEGGTGRATQVPSRDFCDGSVGVCWRLSALPRSQSRWPARLTLCLCLFPARFMVSRCISPNAASPTTKAHDGATLRAPPLPTLTRLRLRQLSALPTRQPVRQSTQLEAFSNVP